MKIVSFLFLILFSLTVNAQVTRQWVATYNGPANKQEWANSIAVDKQGNVYVTGCSEGIESGYDYATIKYNSEGVEQWDARYNGPGNKEDWSRSLAIDDQGNVYVTGWSYGIGSGSDYATIKYNSEGIEQWVARYGLTTQTYSDEAHSITVDNEGHIYVTGTCRNSTGNYYVTIKYNSEGDETWVRLHDEPKWSEAVAIKTDDAGNVYITGYNTITSPAVNQGILTIKYNSEGVEQWINRFNGLASSFDYANALAIDKTGNVYVAGGPNYVTIKYNAAGGQEWAQYYNGSVATSLAVDSSGNVIATGVCGTDFATIKYNSSGIQQWVSIYNGTENSDDGPSSILVDFNGNSYVTGFTTGSGDQMDIATIKYNPEGVEAWVAIYSGPANQNDCPYSSAIDEYGNIYVTGQSYNGGDYDYVTIKYAQNLKFSITKPVTGSKFIAGQIDTIKWSGGQTGQIIQIDYSVDNGNTYIAIDSSVSASSGYYLWDLPDSLLTTKVKIRITDMDKPEITDESDVFRIKPYLLTRLNEDSTYYAYRKVRDQFGFRNSEDDMWPQVWYNRFNYKGTDPFTGKQYPQVLFALIESDWFPDWISWVNAFSVSACYFNTDPAVYNQAALMRWVSALDSWDGSCFGIAVANALVFSHRDQFYTAFPDFPFVSDPIDIISDDGVKSTVNELYTHIFGKLYHSYELEVDKKTPYQTLQEIKQMLIEDNAKIQTLYIASNEDTIPGAHEVLPYELKHDSIQNNLYYVQVYDNAYPDSNNPITFDLTANSGNGSWSTPDYPGWGGNWLIQLDPLSDNFFNNATRKNSSDDDKSPFILPDDRLEIINNPNSDIRIRSFNTGQISGYSNKRILNEIPNSIPLMLVNGSERPPYGYSLPAPEYDFYIIELNNFHSDKINTFFFTGNKSFLYQRDGVTQSNTEQIYFDGGIHVNNYYDDELKAFSLLSLVNETKQEKLCILRSLKTNVNEEVVMDIPDSNTIKITTYSTAQEYNIELNYLTGNGIGKFICNNITLPENSSHTIIPDWENLTDSMLIVLVDLNDDYIIDDTLYFNNLYTGFGDDENSPFLPRRFSMSQNYPNPFDKTTSITYQLPAVCKVTLKVFDLVGKEVATLVDENKPAGNYKVEFDGSQLTPGIYFYKLKSGNKSLTRKMILQ
jgi:uncharacterized delta-60 repeat protein